MPTIKFNLTSSHNVSLNCKFNDSYSYFMTDRMSVVTEFWKCGGITWKKLWYLLLCRVFPLSLFLVHAFPFLLALKTNLAQRYAVSLPELLSSNYVLFFLRAENKILLGCGTFCRYSESCATSAGHHLYSSDGLQIQVGGGQKNE